MKKNIIIILAIVAFIGILASKQITGSKESIKVEVTHPTKGQIADSILASGNLVFNTQVQMRSEVTGRVAEVLVEEGQNVAKGDVLMRLDTKAFEADVERSEAVVKASEIDIKSAIVGLKNIERKLKRQEKMFKVGLSDAETYDDLTNQLELATINIEAKRAQLDQAKASLSIAKDRLNKSVFRSPMTGLLASVDIKAGETVIAGTTNIIGSNLMLIADPSAILAELRVDETDISSIKLGQKADIFAAAYPDEPFTGKVINIGTSAKNQAGSNGLSFKVKVLLDKTDRPLYAGMSSRAEIASFISDEALKLPIEAVHQDDNKYYVWVVSSDNSIKKQNVKVGISSDIEQSIKSGLTEKDKIITGPARPVSKLKDGDIIEIKTDNDDSTEENA
ncbi:efflux RND transporter periplasmic adaptor subunit [Parashewanella spongiae]|uniref:Efflux RND transporter periplasmic adaptor subunit n=1 Tax=Parashewanella spongiae TaxID=342950 RepID=A0A3A6UFS9_9GAMM|nr:efflux RND transporter periplasmic adaptor subunit [Parashewanella spongiae]MCL1078220.1 efflux RND transporter periplasmic adaptor subunit [Parashewanella spongiae]RJY16288.1 efflux RND transporter periplasmic adaptor subunit [Parashewanella spongiae]